MAKGARVIVKGSRREKPDIERLARALIKHVLSATAESTSSEKLEPSTRQEEAS